MEQPKQKLALADVAAILAALARERDPQMALRVFDAVAQRAIGHRLLTVMRHLEASAEVERIYSSNPAAYPCGGRKHKAGAPWGERVLDRGEVFIAGDQKEVRAAFADFELIFSLGIGAIMNVPIMLCGRCLGVVNFCGDADQYGAHDVGPGMVLAGLLVPLMLGATAAE